MHAQKYIVNTDSGRSYILYIINAEEFNKSSYNQKYIGLFLYYDEDNAENPEKLWMKLRHRIMFENSVDAIKDKVIEYTEGRNEKIFFLEVEKEGLPV